MGWNKQSGEHWELQRTAVGSEKALLLKISGWLTIADAETLMRALHDEIVAARMSEGERFVAETLEAKEQMFGDAVLKNWDEVLGVELYPWQRELIKKMASQDDLKTFARRKEAHAWINAFGDATPPPEIADLVAEIRAER